MDNISTFQQKNPFQFIAISSISFFDEFNSQFFQSFSKYKRLPPLNIFDDFEFFGSFEFFESFDDDDSFSTEIESPEWISNGQAKMWRNEIKKKLQQILKIAVLCNAKNEEKQLYRKIGIYRNFIQLEYFETLKLYFEIIVEFIKNEIIKTTNDFSLLDCIDNVDSFFSNCSFSSIFIDFVSVFSSSSKKLKVLFKTEKFAKTLTIVRKNSTFRQTTNVYEVNRQIVANRIFEKKITTEFHENMKLFLIFVEKTTFFRFVNQFVALGFSPRLFMLEEKTVLMFRKKNEIRIFEIN